MSERIDPTPPRDAPKWTRWVSGAAVLAVAGYIAWHAWAHRDDPPDAPVPSTEKRTKPPHSERDRDPAALAVAAWARGLVRGDPVSAGSGEEALVFAQPDRHRWRAGTEIVSKEAFDEAWAAALERIGAERRYGDLRSGEFAAAPPGSTVERRLAQAARSLRMAPDPRLFPLGADPGSGLEEFAVVGSGRVRTRHPDPAAERGRDMVPEPGDAIVLVLVPGTAASSASSKQSKPSPTPAVRTFLIAKSEATVSQVNADAMRERPADASARTTVRHEGSTAAAVLKSMSALGLRLPTQDEWILAAQAGVQRERSDEDHDAQAWYADNAHGDPRPPGQRAPNAFGLFDVFGNVAEWCAAPDAAPNAVKGDPPRVLRGGGADDSLDYLGYTARREVDPSAPFGVRPARDVPVVNRGAKAK